MQRSRKRIEKDTTEKESKLVGDTVAIKRTQFVAGSKLKNQYLGPYKVISVKQNDRYDVERLGNTEGPSQTTTSADNMKMFVPFDESSSEEEEEEKEEEEREEEKGGNYSESDIL